MMARANLIGRLNGFARRFRIARRGAAAIEFAMLAMPFFGLLCGIMDIGLIFVVSTTLENATNSAARQIRTGQTQSSGTATAATFVTTICGNLSWLGSACSSSLNVDVRTFAQFSSIAAPQPVSNGVFNPAALTFNPGAACDIVVVRSYYQWPLFAPLMDQALQTLGGGKALITAAATFRNEPYTGSTPTCQNQL
ncbi:MAG TPA: TadE/TadG family type IV pilus assembly protein [Caulobacteraceae bacterium]|jgi:Flp pilus assembly protein TadG|nr:TadE/TadG family type IV pilus assembly protein [Caulobacteraceae bacterium]